VLETDDPLAGYTDKVEQRFVAKQNPADGFVALRLGRAGEAGRTRAKVGG
jgi:hypothetical protein